MPTRIPSSRVDLAEVTETYFDDFEDPNVINTGWCYVWAWMAHLRYNNAVLCTYDAGLGNDAHAFVRIGDLYYDSSRPRGTRRPKTMWFFAGDPVPRGTSRPRFFDGRRCYKSNIMEQTDDQFVKWWTLRGRRDAWGQQGLKPWPYHLVEPWSQPAKEYIGA